MTPEEYRNRVRALLPALRERAPDAERLRRLPDETLKEFQEAGLFRALPSSLAPTGTGERVGGGHAVFLHNPIQQAWRDVHAMRAHASNSPDTAAMIYGRSEFSLPPQDLRSDRR